ncbi:hypothetical protein Tco_0491400 [Tanacetum coccineum]
MGYEKLSQKLTFFKAFFSPQWKFLILTILQCLSAKTTAWNEFNSTMASAIICLAINQKFNFSKYIFESMVKNLDDAGKFLMYPRFIQVFLDNQLEGMSSHKRIYVTPSYTKKIFANIRRQGKDFSRRETPLFPTMVVQAQEEIGEGSAMPNDPHHTPIVTQPSSSQPQRKQKSRRPTEKDTQVPQFSVPSNPTNVADEAVNEEPRKKGGSRTHKLKRSYKVGRSARVVSSDEASLGDQEDASKQGRKIHDIDKDAEITLVDETQGRYGDEDMFGVNDLDGDEVVVESEVTDKAGEKRNIVEEAVAVKVQDKGKGILVEEPVKSIKKKDQLRLDEELAFKLQAEKRDEERLAKIKTDCELAQRLQAEEEEELTVNEKATLIGMLMNWNLKELEFVKTIAYITLENVHDAKMFDVNDLHGDEVFVEKEVPVKEVSVVGKVNTASIATTVSAATITKDEITLAQALAELKSVKPKVTTATTTTTKGIILQEPSESTTTTTISSKDKDKGIMVEEPLKMKKKDQIGFDEQEAIRLQAEFDKEVRLTREKDEANVALIEEWNEIQAKIETDYELAQRLQAQEHEELTIDEKATLFQQLLEKSRKHFAAKRAEEKRNRPPIGSQQRSIMCTYLKNMAGWKPKDLKSKSFANIQELFDKAFKRVNTFVDFRTELVEGTEMEEISKKVEQKVDDDQEATKMKALMKIVPDEEEVAVDAIPLATKPPSIVDWKIVKEGKISYYEIIRADGSSKRYSAFIQMLRSFDKEDLKTLWKLVKAKHSVEESTGRIGGIKRLLDDLSVTANQLMLLVYKLLLLVSRVNAAGTKLQLLKDYNY